MGNISPFAFRAWLGEEMRLAESVSGSEDLQVIQDAELRKDELFAANAMLNEYLKLSGE